MRHSSLALILLAAATPCFAQARLLSGAAPDSVRLDRIGAATGGYPTYRVTVDPNGAVRFESLTPGDSGRIERSNAGPEIARRIYRVLDIARFYDLPLAEFGKAPYCEIMMSDVGGTRVTVFRGSETRARMYSGCIGGSTGNNSTTPLNRRVQLIADSIEAITGAKQWVRAVTRCCEESKPR